MRGKTRFKYALALGVAAVRPRLRRSLPVLTYHSVGADMPHSTTSTAFLQHLEAIRSIPEMDFLDWQRKTTSLNQACLVTFDDGYLDNFICAAPILADQGVKALFFVTTGFLEGIDITKTFKSYAGLPAMSWDQVGALLKQGHSVGLHGHTHRDFGKMSDAQTTDEFLTSLELFRRRLGFIPDCFAYPFGQFQHRKPSLVANAVAHGVRFIFTTDHRVARLDDLAAPSALLPRLRVDADDNAAIIKQKIRGAWDFVATIQRVKSSAVTRSLAPFFS